MLQNVTTTWFVTRSKACRKGKAASWNSAVLSIVVAFSHKAANVFVGQRGGVATNCQQTLCGSEGFLHNPRLCGISACLNPTGINAANPIYSYLFGGNFQPSTTFRAVYNPKLWVGGGKRHSSHWPSHGLRMVDAKRLQQKSLLWIHASRLSRFPCLLWL